MALDYETFKKISKGAEEHHAKRAIRGEILLLKIIFGMLAFTTIVCVIVSISALVRAFN